MKYFIYARKSTDEDDRQILSIEAQLTELREYANRESLEVADEFVESETAKTPGRPIFNQMIDQVEKSSESFGILSWHPDRLARNSVDGGKIIYLIDDEKIKALKFPTFWFEPTPQGKFMLNIAFGQSKYYIDNLSENIKRGIRQKLRQGEWPALAPIGYLNDLRTHTIVKDPCRWKTVRKLFESYSTGKYTLEALQKLSLSLGLISRRTGKAIVLSKLQDMLQNPFYYGVFIHKGEMYQASHEPIISHQLFEKVQVVLKQRGKPRKIKEPKHFAFRGIFTCGECGRAITAEKKVKPSGLEYIYYRCTKKNKVCHQRYVEQKELVKQLDELFQKVGLNEDWRDKFMNQLEKDKKQVNTKSNHFVQNLESELSQLKNKQMKLLDSYLDETINHEEYIFAKQKIVNQQVEINQKLKDFGQKGNNWLEPMKNWINEAYQAYLLKKSENLDKKRSFLQKIGSNFQIQEQKALISLAKPWVWSAQKSEFTEWSCIVGEVITYFRQNLEHFYIPKFSLEFVQV